MSRENLQTRRQFCKTMVVSAAGALMGTAGCAIEKLSAVRPKSRRPNLLFVFSDQQSRDILGCYGNEQIITPNLERFAAMKPSAERLF